MDSNPGDSAPRAVSSLPLFPYMKSALRHQGPECAEAGDEQDRRAAAFARRKFPNLHPALHRPLAIHAGQPPAPFDRIIAFAGIHGGLDAEKRIDGGARIEVIDAESDI